MTISIKSKSDGEAIMTINIPTNQNPIEAVLNWCDNMGYRFCEIEWRAE